MAVLPGDRRQDLAEARRAGRCSSGAAAFWASRATRGSDGNYHIDGVTGPDEENPDVNDEVYTNVGADDARSRTPSRPPRCSGSRRPRAGRRSPPVWSFPSTPTGHPPEFAGYGGQLVKQADVTLLQLPVGFACSASVARSDLDYYVPRTDPGGPSMSDAVNPIDNAALGTPGCASYVYTERSYEPFIRDVFHQFSETQTGGAFTFMTGIGGFLQEFLYGYSGMRWGGTASS